LSDQTTLFAILCLVYLSDCFLWVERHGVAFVTRIDGQWTDKRPGILALASKGGILLLNPFPPIGKVVRSRVPPLSISPLGVYSPTNFNRDASDALGTAITFSDIKDVAASDRHLLVNGDRFQRLGSPEVAKTVSGLIKKLRNTSEEKRGPIIEQFLSAQFKIDSAGDRLNRCLTEIRPLTYLGNALFVYLFILSPIIMHLFQQSELLIWIAAGMLIVAAQIALGYYQLHKRLYPEASGERIGNAFKMVICPPVSIRVCDLITRDLLAAYHPLLIARLLFSEADFLKSTGQWLRRMTYSGRLTDQTSSGIAGWYRKTLVKLASDNLGLDEETLQKMLGAPAPNDAAVKTYCPRCHSQFLLEYGQCPDCPEIGLVRFEPAAKVIATER
jgi:hypothetical protein